MTLLYSVQFWGPSQGVGILYLVVVPDLGQGGSPDESAVRYVSCQGEVLKLHQKLRRLCVVAAGQQHIPWQQALMHTIAVMSEL